MSKPYILGLDTETTGLSFEKGDRIIEFAGILYDPDTQQPLAKLVQRFDPERAISAGSQAVHGIMYDDLIGKPKFRDMAPKIAALLLQAQAIVIHNAPFDLTFVLGELKLARALREVDAEKICAKTIDTCDDARWATFNGKMPTLGELCYATEVLYDEGQAHAAEYDVLCMMKAYFAGVNDGWFRRHAPESIEVAA